MTPKIRRYKAGTIGPTERLWLHSRQGGGCWPWVGTIGNHGYGVLRHDGVEHLAHRFAYQILVEPIPDDLTIDHLCCNKVCVNPSHMEVVTRGENARRGEKLRKTRSGGRTMSARTQCRNGHTFTPETTRTTDGYRRCLICSRLRSRKFRARRTSTTSQGEQP